jgi:hypothetical protein
MEVAQHIVYCDVYPEIIKPYKDGRSVAGKRYTEATTQSKPELTVQMMKRDLRNGFDADYVVADSWFGTKVMIRTAVDLDIDAILRMKKSKMKYRAEVNGRKKQLLDAK